MTQRKPWPKAANQARDEAVMEASVAINELEGALRGGDVFRVIAMVISRLHKIVQILRSVH